MLTKHTNAESHRTFADAVVSLGQGVDPRTKLRHTVLVDSVPLGDRLGEMRKPGTSFYEQTYAEANAVAGMSIDLGLDREGVVGVLRRPPPLPDIELTVGADTRAFVEQTMVMDQVAHRLSLDVERLNASARRCEDRAIVAAFDRGMLTLRFQHIPPEYYEHGLPVDDVLAEIYALVTTLDDELRPIVPDGTQFPLLAGLKTFGSYHVGDETVSPVMLLTDHGRSEVFADTFVGQIRKKRTRAAAYPSSCRPLWLLLNVDHHFGLADYTKVVRALIARENPVEFDRIVVQQTYAPLTVIDYPRP